MDATESRRRSLIGANRARFAQARWKEGCRELTHNEARERIIELLANPPELLLGLRLEAILTCPAGWGPFKARAIMRRCRVGGRSLHDIGHEARMRLAREVLAWPRDERAKS